MIIVSQDKEIIINYDNLDYITIGKNEEEEYAVMIHSINNEEFPVGIYNSEKRVKEILQEIIKTYKTTEGYKCSNNLSFHKELIEDAERNNRDVFLYVMPSK